MNAHSASLAAGDPPKPLNRALVADLRLSAFQIGPILRLEGSLDLV